MLSTLVAKARILEHSAEGGIGEQYLLQSLRAPEGPPALPPESRRGNQIMAREPEMARKLTLAARKGEDLSDVDVHGMLEGLEDLDIAMDPREEDRA